MTRESLKYPKRSSKVISINSQLEKKFTGIPVLEAHSLFHIRVKKFWESKKYVFNNISMVVTKMTSLVLYNLSPQSTLVM